VYNKYKNTFQLVGCGTCNATKEQSTTKFDNQVVMSM
jgi:hypothetical protein